MVQTPMAAAVQLAQGVALLTDQLSERQWAIWGLRRREQHGKHIGYPRTNPIWTPTRRSDDAALGDWGQIGSITNAEDDLADVMEGEVRLLLDAPMNKLGGARLRHWGRSLVVRWRGDPRLGHETIADDCKIMWIGVRTYYRVLEPAMDYVSSRVLADERSLKVLHRHQIGVL